VVVAGKTVPEVDISWKHCTTRPKLECLSIEDVQRLARLVERSHNQVIDPETIFLTSGGGIPEMIGGMLDRLFDQLDQEW
jgi:hypothetical protein